MKRRKQSNKLKLFYYSHPYFVIFNLLIIYNLILIAAAALVMTYLMSHTLDANGNPLMQFDWSGYLKNLEYCVVFTMNTGGIYDNAPTAVIVLKIILSVLQMITFTGALIGLATSILQSMFDKRIHNIGKIKIKHHFVILEWSAVGANLIRELSFMSGDKTIVILSNKNRDDIQEEIDNLFLETGTSKKHLKIFVKQGNASSRKALKEINIDKAASIAILGASSWLSVSKQNDSTSFKILMTVLSITKKANIIIETDDPEVTKNIHDLMNASPDLSEANISIFSRNTIVGNVLAKTSVNASYANLYYALLSFQGGTFFAIEKPYSVSESLERYSNCLPCFRYNCGANGEHDYLFVNSVKESSIVRTLMKKKVAKTAPFKKNISKESFSLFVIGKNDRSDAIEDAVEMFNSSKEGNISLNVYPTDFDIDELISIINKTKGNRKVLILSNNEAEEDDLDGNVFLTLIKLKANKEIKSDVEIFAEIFDPSNRFSLESLNISGVIIANQVVAVYMSQLMCHVESHKFYEDLLMPETKQTITFEIRRGEELLSGDNNEFASRADFVSGLYESSKHEYLPIGFIGEKSKTNIVDAVGNAVGDVVNVTGKMLSSIGNVLTLADTPEEMTSDFKNITFLNTKLYKKEKIVVKKDTLIIVVHNKGVK